MKMTSNRGDTAPTQTALRIAITGHRFLTETGKLRTGVRRALRRVCDAFPARSMIALSALSEGADRLVTEELLALPDTRLLAVLPVPPQEYCTDFSSEESIAEFERLLARADEVSIVPKANTRAEAYAAAGRAIVSDADAVITLWDGREARGPGGTGDLAQWAIARGVPVFHVKTGNRLPGTAEPTTLGPEQGQLVVYNL